MIDYCLPFWASFFTCTVVSICPELQTDVSFLQCAKIPQAVTNLFLLYQVWYTFFCRIPTNSNCATHLWDCDHCLVFLTRWHFGKWIHVLVRWKCMDARTIFVILEGPHIGYHLWMNTYPFKILGFYRDVDEAFGLVGCYAMYDGSCLPAFQESPSLPSSQGDC